MRLEALRMMRLLSAFRPRLIGSVLTGHVRKGSDIVLHIFSDHLSAVTSVLDDENLRYTVERKRVTKHNHDRVFTHIHVADRRQGQLCPQELDHRQGIERASIPELEQLLREEDPALDLDSEIAGLEDHLDRYELYRLLLEPLEHVKQNPASSRHPESSEGSPRAGHRRSFAALRMTSTCVLVVGVFHALRVSRTLMLTPGEGVFLNGTFTIQTPSPALPRSTGGGRGAGHDFSDAQ
jgi:hypothetical protein